MSPRPARVEQTLFEGGHGEDVIRQRMVFQDVMRHRLEQVVEHATGRKAIGFMSGNQQDPDMICEVFVLTPQRPRALPGSVDAYNAYRQFAIEFIEARNWRIDAAEVAGWAPQAHLDP